MCVNNLYKRRFHATADVIQDKLTNSFVNNNPIFTWWRQQIDTFFPLLAICVENSPVPGELPAQRPVTRSFDVFFDLCLNKRPSKQSWGCRLETPLGSLCRHYGISQEICTRFCYALFCCGYGIVQNEFTWSIYPYSSVLLCWHWGNG